MLIGIQDEILRLAQLGLLKSLLKDQTTGRKIRWATDAYTELGRFYERNAEITTDLITGEHSGVIRNRARKALELQSDRTKSHAEVFTPLWVCKKMLDEITPTTNDIIPPKTKPSQSKQSRLTKFEQQFIKSRYLEITCGEAPFLVQRYDTITGEILPMDKRDGILDRKLQLICKKNFKETTWLKWTFQAFKTTYGYELQGDNLLIARLNLYMTFEEYLEQTFHRKPKPKESQKVIDIITWNLWQMNGLTNHSPCEEVPPSTQKSLFDLMGLVHPNPPKPCQIRLYQDNQDKVISISELAEQGAQDMKFDYIVGNPPYQEETIESISSLNGQASVRNIFHFFQKSVDKITTQTSVLIYPSKRWLHRSGKGMNEFGLSQINDVSLSKIINYPNAKDIFKESSINDGVGIVIKNYNKSNNGFIYEYHKDSKTICIHLDNPGEDLIILNPDDYNICNKVNQFVKKRSIKFLNERILPRSLFGIESDFVQRNPSLVKLYTPETSIDYSKQIKLLTNDKAGSAGRTKCYITNRDIIQNNKHYIDEWQVIAISANPGGQRRNNQLEIVDNHTAFGRSKVALGSFSSETEAQNFYTYLKTYLIRYMFLMTDENLSSLGKKVPDILDYTNNNKLVDFSKNLDSQLFKIFDLSEDEVDYIKSTIDTIKKKRGES